MACNSFSVDYYLSKGYDEQQSRDIIANNKKKVSEGVKKRKGLDRYQKTTLVDYISFDQFLEYEQETSNLLSRAQAYEILEKLMTNNDYTFNGAVEHIVECYNKVKDKYKRVGRSKDFIMLLYGPDSLEYKKFREGCKVYASCSFEKFSQAYEDKGQAMADFKKKYGSMGIESIMERHKCTEAKAQEVREERIAKRAETWENKSDEEKRRINKSKAQTLENYIRKYGLELGRIKYENLMEVRRKTGTLDYYIGKYGEVDGPKKYKEEKQQTYYNKEYWINKGYTEQEAEEKLKDIFENRPSFSKQYCIGRYGYQKGIEVWKNRQLLWQATLQNKSDEEKRRINDSKAITLENQIKKYGEVEGKKNYIKVIEERNKKNSIYSSKEATAFFTLLYKRLRKLGVVDKKEPYFATSGSKERFIYSKKNARVFFYDFCIEKLKIIVEYHGVCFHPREDIEWKPFYSDICTDKNRALEYDILKERVALESGYEYHIIWSDYVKDDINNQLDRIVNIILEKEEFLNG